MTLPGGPANKLGNRYEKLWTVSQLVQVLMGNAESLRIEVPGIDKAEFVVNTGQRKELHQAKRTHPSGKWSIASLTSAKDPLLQTVGEELDGNQDRFIFASGSQAPELFNLCEAANSAESLKEFEQCFVAAAVRKEPLKKLLVCWSCNISTAFERLKRIEVRTIGERDLDQSLQLGIQAICLANPHRVLSELLKIG